MSVVNRCNGKCGKLTLDTSLPANLWRTYEQKKPDVPKVEDTMYKLL